MTSSAITIKEYFARDGSEFNKKDAAVIGPVLHSLSEQGGVTSRDVVDAARSTNSPIHPYFEWNDKVAADQYRLWQAREMLRAIRVRYEDRGGETHEARAFHVTRSAIYEDGPRKYRTFQVLHGESAFAAQMMQSAYDDLMSWRRKYEPYRPIWKNFSDTFAAVINQIGECEQDVGSDGLPFKTDEAITDLLRWREQFQSAADTWAAWREQMEFLMDAIADAESVFCKTIEAKERSCARCSKPFHSVGAGNRLCKSCSNLKSVNEKTEGVGAISLP